MSFKQEGDGQVERCEKLATGHGVIDQIVDAVECDGVDCLLNFVEPGRFVFQQYHDCRFDGWAAGFHAGDFFDNDRCLWRKFQGLSDPYPNLI